MWAGQAARCQGRRSVVGAAEARGRVKPRSSAASVPPPRAGARRGHLGRSQVRRRGGAGPAPPQRAVSQRIRGGYVAERRERGRSRADARSLSSLPVKEMGKTKEEVGRCAAECLA